MGLASNRTRPARALLAGVLVTFLPACWIIAGLDERAPSGDAPDGDVSGSDGGSDGPRADALVDGGGPDVDAGRCNVADPFTSSKLVTGLNSPLLEGAATLGPDELDVIFSSDWNFEKEAGTPGGATNLYVAHRADRSAAFAVPQRLMGGSVGTGQASPALTADKQTLYFASYSDVGIEGADIAVASRDNSAGGKGLLAFDMGILMPAHVSAPTASEDYVTVSAAGDELIFARTATGQLFDARRDSPTTFAQPKELGKLEAQLPGQGLYAPALSADGLTLYFAAAAGSNMKRIYRAQRAMTTEAFTGPVVEHRETAEGIQQTPLWISPDLCRLYVAQNRGGAGSLDLRVYEKSPR